MEKRTSSDKILEVKDLRISFRTNGGTVKAVRGISFPLYRGRTLAIVGESGSGKSVTSKAILGILAGNKIIEDGQIIYDGQDLLKIDEEHFHKIRGVKIGMIFQDPLSSLNPIMIVGKQLTEAMVLKQKADRKEAKANLALLREALKKTDETLYLAYKSDEEHKVLALKPEDYKDGFLKAAKHIEEARNYGLSKILPDLEALLRDSRRYEDRWATLDGFKKDLLDPAMASLAPENGVMKLFAKEIKASNRDRDPSSLVEALIGFFELVASKNFETPEKEAEARYALCQKTFEGLESEDKALKEEAKKNLKELEKYLSLSGDALLAASFLSNGNRKILSLDPHKHNVLFEKLVERELDERLALAKDLLPKLNAIVEESFIGEDTDIEGTIKKLRELKKDIERCILPSTGRKDNIIEVFDAILKDIKESYKASQKSEKRLQKAYEKSGVTDFFSLPASIRATLPEKIKTKKDFVEELLSAIHELVARLEEIIEHGHSKKETVLALTYRFAEDSIAKHNHKESGREIRLRAIQMLREVGIDEPERRYKQYPFELSGGMRQRIVIAIALCSNPELLICDEPTTALDVTIQAQILELINKLKKERNLSIVFITHDLGVVANMADDIAVMYAGKIVEFGSDADIFYDPRHPYTWALLGSMPDLETKEQLSAIPGTPPNMLLPPKGDAFAPRNVRALDIDMERQPPYFAVSATHYAATWNLHPEAPDFHAPDIVIARIKKALDEHPDFTPRPDNYKNSILKDLGKEATDAE